MAYSVNKVILIGNLGKDPEVRFTQSGKAVAKFSLATSERGKDGQDRTEWHNVVVWEKLAELCGRLLAKGSKAYVEGRLQTREYTDRDGNRRWSTEVVAREVVFLSESRGGGARRDGPPHPAESWDRGGQGGGQAGGQGGGQAGGQAGGQGGGQGGGWDRGPAQQGAEPADEIPFGEDEEIPF